MPGIPVVLTADRTLMAGYDILLDGMLAAGETTATPCWLGEPLLLPKARRLREGARLAPLGLRRIEAALLNGGFYPEDVAVVGEEDLERVIGPDTRVVGVSAGEPGGHGMSSTTMTAIAGGEIYPAAMFRRLMQRINDLRTVDTKVVLGGPGAWQFADNASARLVLGIDHLVTGYAEGNAAAIFRVLAEEKSLPAIVPGENVSADHIPRIDGAASLGAVEISRGCGLGCTFCTLGRGFMEHLPPATILADAEKNLAGGCTSLSLLSEDAFRYGADGLRARPEMLIGLLEALRALPRVRLLQLDHANLCTVAQYADDELRAVRDLMVGRTGGRMPWLNVGVETAAGHLLWKNGGLPKMDRHVEDWGDYAATQLRRLITAGFFPIVSLQLGLPGETESDIRQTQRWVDGLRGEPLSIYPLLHAPIDGREPVTASRLRIWHWALIRACYEFNFTWMPRLYEDNQRAAGVAWTRRLLMKTLAPFKTMQWRQLLAQHAGKSR